MGGQSFWPPKDSKEPESMSGMIVYGLVNSAVFVLMAIYMLMTRMPLALAEWPISLMGHFMSPGPT